MWVIKLFIMKTLMINKIINTIMIVGKEQVYLCVIKGGSRLREVWARTGMSDFSQYDNWGWWAGLACWPR